MPSDPTGSFVRNLVTLRRIANGLSGDMRRRVVAMIDEFVAEAARIDPTAPGRDRYRQQRVDRLLAAIRQKAGPSSAAMRRELESALARVGAQQAGWAAGAVASAVGDVASVDVVLRGVGVDRFRQIFRAEPFHGKLMSEWFREHSQDTLNRTAQQIRLGMAQDETLGDIIRRIRGRSVGGGRFTGGVVEASTRWAETIARTGVTFIANKGHTAAYEENSDVIQGVEFTATLDARTTAVCARWDGTVWALDDPGRQEPPLHPNCRSVLTPVVNWKELGVDPPAEGTRASAEGQVSASTTYEQWFRGRSTAEQNEIIGPARAKLFRDGKLSFKDMIGRDNRILTLDELDAA